ncbi:exo-alpha-sialidase [Planctomicrobium sp. SH527]|uniref:exo-alpha-sialidase n=1 Tax=Planctomicrobium sp. SH527 TaxID=3448123 RepID=UPI003F5BF9F3
MLARLLTFSLVLLMQAAGSVPLQAAENSSANVQVRKIWDKGNHNAFTDLIVHNGKWFCVFREGQGHVSPDGALRVLTSNDGQDWKSAALVTMKDVDLRDAKISVTPEGNLMLCGAGATQPPAEKSHQTYIWTSKDGSEWSEPTAIGDKNFWIWRIVWNKGDAYGIGYGTTAENRSVRLYKSTDGKTFKTLVQNMGVGGYPNETAIHFQEDGTAYCVLRLDNGAKDSGALLGTSQAPYTDWKWEDLGVRIGGPEILKLTDGRFVVSGRSYVGGAKTKVWFLDPKQKKLTELVTLPSGGDTSYPGLVQQGDNLWVSYYSSHEGKTNIYMATIKLK